MAKDRSDRRTYRKSPGRQYGYEYNPLKSRSGSDGQAEHPGPTRSREEKSQTQLAPRPDLRRTRQLLRQNIIASKGRLPNEDEEHVEQQEVEQPVEYPPDYDETPQPRYPTSNRLSRRLPPQGPSTRDLEEAAERQDWQALRNIDPDLGYEEPMDVQYNEAEIASPRASALPTTSRNIQRRPTRAPGHPMRPVEPPEYDDDGYEYEYEEEEEEGQPRRRNTKRKVSRRGLLTGLGVVAVGGAGIAAYELVPKIPQALNNAGANIQHQIDDAFKNGVAQGADAVRREFVTTLETLEGVSLDSAISAAVLTRVAYDTFVSPIIKFSANIAGDFLSTMLQALRSARGFLAQGSQDNSTLASIQKVLETWVAQISNMPKQLDAITDTDLDGAQSYLHKLKITVEAEKAKLNNSPQATPTPQPKGTPQKH